jgi:hypothetical protein
MEARFERQLSLISEAITEDRASEKHHKMQQKHIMAAIAELQPADLNSLFRAFQGRFG